MGSKLLLFLSMTLKQYLIIMTMATIMCWVAWFFVLLNVDPWQANNSSFFFFYLTTFFALLGTFSLLMFVSYKVLSRSHAPMFRYVQKSFRDGFFGATFVIIILLLQSRGFLNIWNVSVLFVSLILLGGFFFFDKKHKKVNGFI